MTRRAFLTTYRQLFLLLVGLGLLARVLVPVGWMPHVTNGDVRLVLCASYGPVAAQPPVAPHHAMETQSEHGQSAPLSDDPPTTMGAQCPFTFAAAPALLLAGVTSVVPLIPAMPDAPWIAVTMTRASRLVAPPPAIRPPTS